MREGAARRAQHRNDRSAAAPDRAEVVVVSMHEDPIAVGVGALTAAVLVLMAAPVPGFLDAGEFVAAARELGVIHPPGHPGWLSLAGLAELVPIGPIAARVAWFSACWAGVSAALIVRIGRRLLAAQAVTAAQGTAGALVAGLTLAASASLWLVGTRAEVYTLALASNLWAIDAALAAGSTASAGRRPERFAAMATVAVALGLLNHHYLTLFALPAVLVAGWPALKTLHASAGRWRWLVATALIMGLGYLALPLRAVAGVELRWGDPETLAGFWDHITAAYWQRSVSEGAAVTGGVFEGLGMLLFGVVDGLGVPLGALGLFGLIGAILRPSRPLVVAWLMVGGGLLGKALMRVDLSNPDDHGYILLAVAAVALGAGLVASALAELLARQRPRLAFLAVAFFGVLVVGNVAALCTDTDKAPWHQRAPDRIDDAIRQRVPPGGLFLSTYYGTQFQEAAFRLAEGRRPDMAVAHLSMRTGDRDGGRAFARFFAARHPHYAALAKGAVALGRAPIGNVLAFGEQGHVVVEHDPSQRIPAALIDVGAVGHKLLPERERKLDYSPTRLQTRAATAWDALNVGMQPSAPFDRAVQGALLWQHSLDTAAALRRGWRDVARDSLARARAIAPKDRSLDGLEAKLALLDDAWKRADVPAYHKLWQSWINLNFDEMMQPTK